MDFGVDLDLFNGLIQMDFSYYHKKTVDLVNSVTLPSSTGFTSYKDNIGEVVNKGFEVQLRSTLLNTKEWYVAVFANLAHNENEITKISDSMKEYNRRVMDKYANYDTGYNKGDAAYADTYLQYVEGGSLTSIFAVKSLGINLAKVEKFLCVPTVPSRTTGMLPIRLWLETKSPKYKVRSVLTSVGNSFLSFLLSCMSVADSVIILPW